MPFGTFPSSRSFLRICYDYTLLQRECMRLETVFKFETHSLLYTTGKYIFHVCVQQDDIVSWQQQQQQQQYIILLPNTFGVGA
jgi:hypothetical protein